MALRAAPAVGVVPGGGGTQLLTRRIGWSRAADLIFTARRVDGPEAARLGLVEASAGVIDLAEREGDELGRGLVFQLGRGEVQALGGAFETGLMPGVDGGEHGRVDGTVAAGLGHDGVDQ